MSRAPRGGKNAKGKGRGDSAAASTKSGPPEPDAALPVRILAIGVVLAAALAATFQTVRYEFLNWDDTYYVLDNPWIRSFSWDNVSHILTKPYFNNYLPLHLLSYSFDYSLWGVKPYGYHLHQVLLHGLNAILCFLVVRRLLGRFAVALIAGILFAVHPSHVEAVAWISSRKELLSTTFLLLSTYAYLHARRGAALRSVPYAASVTCFALGLLSKLSIVTLPLFFLLHDFLGVKQGRRDGKFWNRALLDKIPFALAGIVALRLNMGVQVEAEAAYARDPLQYLVVKGHAVWNYLVLLGGLRGNSPDYDTPARAASFLPIVANLAGLLVLPVVVWFAVRSGRRSLALGAGWVFATLLPVLAFPLVTYMAERYLYAPSLGFCWIVGVGIVALGSRAAPGSARTIAIASIAAIPLALFAYRTAVYTPVWANSEVLWTYAMGRSQDYRVYTNLAQVRINQKRYDEAERLLKLSVKVENVTTYRSLAALYYDTQRYPEAMTALDKAVEILARTGNDPEELAEVYYTRGAILWVQSQPGKALAAWESALSFNPRHAQAREWVETARKSVPKEP